MNYMTYTDYTRPVDLQQQLSQLQSQIQQMGNNYPTHLYAPMPQAYGNPAPNTQLTVPSKIYKQISKVHGLQGAKEYQSKLSAGSSEIIADDEEDILYMVMVDANGNSPEEITVLDFQIRKQKAEQPQYVTRQDFDAFASEIKALLGKEKVNEQLTQHD